MNDFRDREKGEERKFAKAREVRGLVVVQHELHQPLQEREFRLPAVLSAVALAKAEVPPNVVRRGGTLVPP